MLERESVPQQHLSISAEFILEDLRAKLFLEIDLDFVTLQSI